MDAHDSLLASLIAGAMALVLLVIALRWFDVLAGGWKHFKKDGGPLDHINSGNLAAGLYYGLRFLGASIVVGLVVSAVRYSL
jgi:hypothetical protein